ncbi:N-6 DNA methylase [Francisella philomiragia]|uniref:N-6 DNA Methylase family protein n=1 Tax=Francisella philomiragia TaxID=28110 RepID=A0A0B6D3T2_9GAMM|nr:N-6 DNA methylase [Francisella philomiragia]AJI52333.1 N-6 DNA Methylase family protein [Francisella philomiragia]
MNKEIIDKIFKDPSVKYELSEFEGLGKPIHEMLDIIEKNGTGKQTGKKIYYVKSLAPLHSEKEEIQVYVEDGKSNPEEIVRQLWVYKLINYYGYKREQIELEVPVQFGVEVNTKFADIAVYRDKVKQTVKLLFEIKKPNRKDGIEQLKTYLGAKGNPVGIWSNGTDRLVLYKPDNKEFDTLPEIPKVSEEENDVLDVKRTIKDLKTSYNFKKIIQDLEELVLADSGADEFNEIFKIIFAKIWDEKQANENKRARPKGEVEFKKFNNPTDTYNKINGLFKQACEEWQGVFEENERIRLREDHLQVCIGPIETVKLMGSNLRIMDDAFEYLLPTEAKKKKGQFFTPRHVIEMCVRMMNPKDYEYVMDPSCGSAGFLLHAMEWAVPAKTLEEQENRKHKYAGKYLWGIDFEARAAKTSRALMLIAGDGHTNIFGPDVSSIDPRTWYTTKSGKNLINDLSRAKLLKAKVPDNETFVDKDKAWEYFDEMNFDIILANPPFAGEMKDKKMLINYELAKPALKRAKDKTAKEERDVLFIERIIKMLRPGGRAAIVLPQGKFNNSSLAFIREWILRKARLLAVVGLHGNSFKPHTGTKTSVLFIQKYTDEQLQKIKDVQEKIRQSAPDYKHQIEQLLKGYENDLDIMEENIPEEIYELVLEEFEEVSLDNISDETDEEQDEQKDPQSLEEKIDLIDEKIANLEKFLVKEEYCLNNLDLQETELKNKHRQEEDLAKENRAGSVKDFNIQYKPIKEARKLELKDLKDKNKEIRKELKKNIKSYENMLEQVKEEKLLLTNKGKLELLLVNEDSIEKLKNRYIDSKVAKELDYPIFMAVSEKGGKNNSGDYEYLLDDDGNIIEDEYGNPEINQDLVNHKISRDDLLNNIDNISYDDCCIAEAFVKFAKEQEFDFWSE